MVSYLFIVFPQGINFADSRKVIFDKVGEENIRIINIRKVNKENGRATFLHFARVASDEAKEKALSLNGTVYTTEVENPRPMVVQASTTFNDEIWERVTERKHFKRAQRPEGEKAVKSEKPAAKSQKAPKEKTEKPAKKEVAQPKTEGKKKIPMKNAEDLKLPSIYVKFETPVREIKQAITEKASPFRFSKAARSYKEKTSHYIFVRFETEAARDTAIDAIKNLKVEGIKEVAVAVAPKPRAPRAPKSEKVAETTEEVAPTVEN